MKKKLDVCPACGKVYVNCVQWPSGSHSYIHWNRDACKVEPEDRVNIRAEAILIGRKTPKK